MVPELRSQELLHLAKSAPYTLYLDQAFLPGLNLTGTSFRAHSSFLGTCFSFSCLNKAVFPECNLSGCYFNYCDLREAQIRGSNLENVSWTNSCITGAQFSNCSLSSMDVQQLYNKDLTGDFLRIVLIPHSS